MRLQCALLFSKPNYEGNRPGIDYIEICEDSESLEKL